MFGREARDARVGVLNDGLQLGVGVLPEVRELEVVLDGAAPAMDYRRGGFFAVSALGGIGMSIFMFGSMTMPACSPPSP